MTRVSPGSPCCTMDTGISFLLPACWSVVVVGVSITRRWNNSGKKDRGYIYTIVLKCLDIPLKEIRMAMMILQWVLETGTTLDWWDNGFVI